MVDFYGVNSSVSTQESGLKPAGKKSMGATNVPMVKMTKGDKAKESTFPDYDEKKYGTLENYEKLKAKFNYKNDMKDGKLVYNPEDTFFFGLYKQKAYYSYHADKGETNGNIKDRYNLPDKVIKDYNHISGGGNLDRVAAHPIVDIPAEVLDKIVK